MGFLSTLTTQECGIEWPQWFVDKYQGSITFRPGNVGSLHSDQSHKTYGVWEHLAEDIQRAIDWKTGYLKQFVVVYLHDCGGITLCRIKEDTVAWYEPTEWQETEGVEHWYCADHDYVPST